MVTAEELLSLPRGRARYELIRGELRTMSPSGFEHGAVAARAGALLSAHVQEHDLGVTLGAETGFLLQQNPDTVRAPDAAFVSAARLAEVGPTKGYWPGAPDLAIEVISPSDTYSKVEEKVEEWLAAGAGLVLVADPARRCVRAYRPGEAGHVFREEDALDASPVVPGWSVRVAALFG